MRKQDAVRIVILGGGFGGLYTALDLERTLARTGEADVVLVNQDNFFLFTPMLHEVAASDLDITHIVNPIRKLLRRVRFFQGVVESVDPVARRVHVSHGSNHHHHELEYDHLVVALGSVTNFYGLPGLEEHALTMKSLGDAIHLRNKLIANLEQADFECCAHVREPLLTVAVAGGGFAGVETLAGVNDFLREALRYYPNLSERDLRLVLIHSGGAVLPELGPALGGYAARKLSDRGIEIVTGTRVLGYDGQTIALSDGRTLRADTLVWTAGTSPHPLLGSLPCPKERGRILVDDRLAVPGWPGVWALGDAAAVPTGQDGTFHPPTAQHAIREGRTVAANIAGSIRGGPLRPFRFGGLGQLAAIGRRTGVARILGINFSGFVAWWLWRTIYLSKLPRAEKKLRVVLDWTLDLVFSKDLVQFLTIRSTGVSHEDSASIETAGRAARPAAGSGPVTAADNEPAVTGAVS